MAGARRRAGAGPQLSGSEITMPPVEAALILGEATPAGGAAIGEALAATAGALVITALMLGVVVGHRSGRLPQVARVAAFAERSSGIPGWASLPLFFVAGALGVAVLGMYWDISIHLDEGRDEGPLANAAHYFILAGLFGVFFAGVLSMTLPKEGRPSATAIRIVGDWYAPLGGVLMTVSASFALGAFPLDDVWHRFFGQDVTLWGPTHLLLIGGAGLATVGRADPPVGGDLRARVDATPRTQPRWLLLRQAILAGAFLVALSTFQAEYDFSVPQFRLVWHPILLMLAAGIGLVSARLLIGRGGALLAVAGFIAIRGVLSLWVGPLTGHTTLHFPLYIAEALVVEAVALRVGADRPLRFGAARGPRHRHDRPRRRVGLVAHLVDDPVDLGPGAGGNRRGRPGGRGRRCDRRLRGRVAASARRGPKAGAAAGWRPRPRWCSWGSSCSPSR